MRTPTLASAVGIGLALAVVCVTPSGVDAQDASRGWVGISFEVVVTGTPSGVVHRRAVITDVVQGSPARRAGVRPGDVLLSINRIAGLDSLRNIGQHLDLDPGDEVRLVVLRDGRQRVVDVVASARVEQPVREVRYTFSVQPDSMVESIFRAMDSLRLRIVEANGDFHVLSGAGAGDVTVLRPPQGGGVLLRSESPPPAPERPFAVFELREPFEGRLFRGENYDSLLTELQALNGQIRLVKAREDERLRELRARGGNVRRIDNDAELRRLRATMDDLSGSSIRLRKAMEDATWTSAGDAYVARAPRPASEPARADAEVFRPLTPYLLGQNRAAGAEVMDLTPGLAEYFDVDGGVLVVDVPERTFAAVAGIEAGDVIIRIDQVTVRTVQDLRLGLSRAGAEIPITLIRQGASRQVLLRR